VLVKSSILISRGNIEGYFRMILNQDVIPIGFIFLIQYSIVINIGQYRITNRFFGKEVIAF